jgi:murein DD-endopeptidase MepM/ murein hydrolase activator NlpD
MKKYYYYSDSKIHSVDFSEIAGKYKIAGFLVLGLFICTTVGALFLVNTFSLKNNSQEEFLKGKFSQLNEKYLSLLSELEQLRSTNKSLRIAANLPPVSSGVAKLGTGGRTFGSIAEIMTRDGNIRNILDNVEGIIKKFEFEKSNLSEIQSAFASNQDFYNSLPAIKPCTGEVGSKGFGMRYHPILHYTRMHEGIDITTDIGTPVRSTADGQILFTGVKGGYGIVLEVNHGNGYQTVYGHLSSYCVREGQQVKRGEVIAYTGNTGLSTGPHLHYEVSLNGTKVDPENFFFDNDNLFTSGLPN